jgi:predicted alpha/beta superfamily hydrolase
MSETLRMSPMVACVSLALAATLAIASHSALAADSGAKTPSTAASGEPYVMPRSEVRRMRSSSGGDYLVYIAWPEQAPPPEGYPILYLLDGTESFAIAAEFANRLGSYSGMAPGVVVGIGYPDASRRVLDYTPAVPEGVDTSPAKGPTGGADAFLEFLASQVIPGVEAGHRVDANRRTLAGYSLGGLFTLQALFKRPDLFRTYVASSPSIWYGEKQVLELLPGLSERLSKLSARRRLFLSAGQYEQAPAPGKEHDPSWLEIAELSKRARMIDNARALAERLHSMPLHVEFRLVPGETHATGDWPALRDSLQHAFADQP